MAEKVYTKTLVLKADGGDITLTGSRAYAVQRRLDDNGDLINFTDSVNKKQTNYYKINGNSCTFCLVATVTAGDAVPAEPDKIKAEDELGKCA
nr:MAG TPA: hypothetical protein [Caudoviricetes sp.]